MSYYIYLVPLFPLIGFLINGLFRKSIPKSLSGLIGSATILASFIVSAGIFFQVKQEGFQPVIVTLFQFIHADKLTIPFSFLVDPLSTLFLLIITGVGFLIHLYSVGYMKEENAPDYAKYFCYLNLFVFFMLLLVLGSNYVILFIGWEGVGLCSYLLIGYWFKNIDYDNAAKKAFIMNRIGDVGFLIAIFALIFKFNSVSFDTIFHAGTHSYYRIPYRSHFIIIPGSHRKICTDTSLYMVTRCDGRAHAGICTDTCSYHGNSRYIYDCTQSCFV